MKRFIEGEDRNQSTLFPERLDDYIAEETPSESLTCLLMNPSSANLDFVVSSQRPQAGRPTILRPC